MHRTTEFLALIGLTVMLQGVYAASISIHVTDDKGKDLADAVVYIQPRSGTPRTPPHDIEVEQKDKQFHPFVSVTSVGSKAFFPNHDGLGHHVYSFSPVKPFQLPLSESEHSDPVILDKTGIITVGCNIHDWMVAYIYVTDTPYHGVTDARGQVVIDGLPAGTYRVQVTHPGVRDEGGTGREVTLTADTALEMQDSLVIKPEFLWRPQRPDIDEAEY